MPNTTIHHKKDGIVNINSLMRKINDLPDCVFKVTIEDMSSDVIIAEQDEEVNAMIVKMESFILMKKD